MLIFLMVTNPNEIGALTAMGSVPADWINLLLDLLILFFVI